MTTREEDVERALVPREPTAAMWGGLARDIVMWTRFERPDNTGYALHEHLQRLGQDIPDWLAKEIPPTPRTPAKGTVAACIYKAMLDAAPIASLPPDDGLEMAAMWHDQRARDTPDAFETELHQVSAAAIRNLRSQPPQARAAIGDQEFPLTNRREVLALSKPVCPYCGETQIQLTLSEAVPAKWKCRMCKCIFAFEPRPSDLQARAAMPSEGELRDSLTDQFTEILADCKPEYMLDVQWGEIMDALVNAALAERMKP